MEEIGVIGEVNTTNTEKEIVNSLKELRRLIKGLKNDAVNANEYNVLNKAIWEHMRNSKSEEVEFKIKTHGCSAEISIEINGVNTIEKRDKSIIRFIADNI